MRKIKHFIIHLAKVPKLFCKLKSMQSKEASAHFLNNHQPEYAEFLGALALSWQSLADALPPKIKD